mgnify:FL=1
MKTTLTNGWFAVFLSDHLRAGDVNPAIVDGTELVIWRDHSGKAHAWHNRCPHRGTRLSLGFVRGNRLACLYHGWQYGQDGYCKHIPSRPSFTPSKPVGPVLFQCKERDGFVWVSNREEHVEGIPTAHRIESNSSRAILSVRSLVIAQSKATVIDRIQLARFPPSNILEKPTMKFSEKTPAGFKNNETYWLTEKGRFKATYVAKVVSESFMEVSCHYNSAIDYLLAAIQPIGKNETAIHLAFMPHGEIANPTELRLVWARWAKTLR